MANTIFRGELYLTATELESFRQRLEQLCSSMLGGDAAVNVAWQLVSLDTPASRSLHLPQTESIDIETPLMSRRERSSSRHMRKSASSISVATEVPGHSTIDDDIDTLFKEIMDEDDEDFVELADTLEPHQKNFPQQNETVEYDNTSKMYALLYPEQSIFTNLPPWAEKLHKVLSSLCHSKSGNVFVKSPDVDMENNQDAADKKKEKQPPCKLNLEIVLENLINNKYSSTTEAFADVYMTLLAAFSIEAPGNITWMSAQDACSKLEALRRDSNLVDSEIAQVAGFGGKHPPATQPLQPTRQLPVNLDFVVAMQPISSQEKLQFQEILHSLPPERHLELYIAFEYLAVWRNLGNGEIELDDETTNPSVFRDMMKWAKERGEQKG